MNLGTNIKAILFDLDGTLLNIDLNRLLVHYIKDLHEILPNSMTLRELMKHSWNSFQNTIDDRSNRAILDVYLDHFLAPLSLSKKEAKVMLRNYYNTRYRNLKKYVGPHPGARTILEYLTKKKFNIVLATNPFFMIDAVKIRMRWAGIEDFKFDLITLAEEFTYCKPNLDYFNEIFSRTGLKATECLVIRDEQNDMVAKSLGCKTFLIESPMTKLKENTPKPDFIGDLKDLL